MKLKVSGIVLLVPDSASHVKKKKKKKKKGQIGGVHEELKWALLVKHTYLAGNYKLAKANKLATTHAGWPWLYSSQPARIPYSTWAQNQPVTWALRLLKLTVPHNMQSNKILHLALHHSSVVSAASVRW